MICSDKKVLAIYDEICKDMQGVGIPTGQVARITLSRAVTGHALGDCRYSRSGNGKCNIRMYMCSIAGPGSWDFRDTLAHEMLHAVDMKAGHGDRWLAMADKMNRAYPDKYHITQFWQLNSQNIGDYPYFVLFTSTGVILPRKTLPDLSITPYLVRVPRSVAMERFIDLADMDNEEFLEYYNAGLVTGEKYAAETDPAERMRPLEDLKKAEKRGVVCEDSLAVKVFEEIKADMVTAGIRMSNTVESILFSNIETGAKDGSTRQNVHRKFDIVIYRKVVPGPGTAGFRNALARQMLTMARPIQENMESSDTETPFTRYSAEFRKDHSQDALYIDMVRRLEKKFPQKYDFNKDAHLDLNTVNDYTYFIVNLITGHIAAYASEIHIPLAPIECEIPKAIVVSHLTCHESDFLFARRSYCSHPT